MQARITYKNTVIDCPPFSASKIDDIAKHIFNHAAEKFPVTLQAENTIELLADLPQEKLYPLLCFIGNKFCDLNDRLKSITPLHNRYRAASSMHRDWKAPPDEFRWVAEIFVVPNGNYMEITEKNFPQANL